MERYHYNEQELKLIEGSSIACAVYQFVNKRVVTIALSEGFRRLIGVDSLEEAYYLMDHNMYRDAHPDDVAEIADAAVRFATEGGDYDVSYRSKIGEDYIIIHAIGKHIYKQTGERLAVINYVNEGIYRPGDNDILLGIKENHENYPLKKGNVKKIRYDFLTGLPDMNYFFEMAESYHESLDKETGELALIFMDLDGMKAYNQKYGYTEGDKLIKSVGNALVKHFSNDNCCRVTADHFAVYTNTDNLNQRLAGFIKDIKMINDGRTLPIRIGIYDSSVERVSVTTACDRAKIACDSAGNIYDTQVIYFDTDMLKRFEVKRYVIENIDRAISEGWIQVYYQPIVRAANGRVCDEEALVRWIDPNKGLMPPLDFIPVLEDAKISYKLDLYVLEQVLLKLKKQSEDGLYVVSNSINLSRTDFFACDIVEEIRRRVDEAGIERNKITIEITESVLMVNMDFMKIQVERFRELGFRVWMDDFGSGYSSPDILQKIHFDVVKIDKFFVDKIGENEGSRVIITELIRLVNGLGSETVAEGVETVNQVEFLKEIGCTRLQGYFYSKPVPIDTILERYRNGKGIGFENPAEFAYYSAIGNINLYDMSFATEGDESLKNYFNTMPMFIIELGDREYSFIRGNRTYREYMQSHYPEFVESGKTIFSFDENEIAFEYADALERCKETGEKIVTDARTNDGGLIHFLIRRVAVNPVNGKAALAVVMLGYVDNDAEIRHKEELERIAQERKTYARMTALAGNFICIYTVNPVNDSYIEFSSTENFKGLGISGEGEDFYGRSRINGSKVVYIEDMDMFMSVFTKENVLNEIESKGTFAFNYRLMLNGIPRYVSLRAAKISDDEGPQIIVGLIDVDDQIKREQEYIRKLTAARNIANLDILTGVKNKHAYIDAEMQIDKLIGDGNAPEFAVVVFDLNGLKIINDTYGHKAGDHFIKEGCSYICRIFKHSAVYRIGGDEFAVIAEGEDYRNIEYLMDKIYRANLKNCREGGLVIATGMARYHSDRNVSTVFERADTEMYGNKIFLKGIK